MNKGEAKQYKMYSKGMDEHFKNKNPNLGTPPKGATHHSYEKGGYYTKSKSKSKALSKAGGGTGVPKSKWGAKQGNWHKVMPGDR